MATYLAGLPVKASTNISPSTFVCLDTTIPLGFNVCQATGGTGLPIAIAQDGTQNLPGTLLDSGYAATPGIGLQLFNQGDICLLKLGSGGAATNALLVPDANGNGIVTAQGAGAFYGAIALEQGNQNELIKVIVHLGKS